MRAIEQANGTDELAEVTFDEVFASTDRVVGEVGGGWAVAMHILSSERVRSRGSAIASCTAPCSLASGTGAPLTIADSARPSSISPRSRLRGSRSSVRKVAN